MFQSLLLTETLEIESNKLTASIPEYLRHEVTGINTGTPWVDTTQLAFIIAGHSVKDLIKNMPYSQTIDIYLYI